MRRSLSLVIALSLLAWIAAACSNGSGTAETDLLTADVRGVGGGLTGAGGPVPGGVANGPSGPARRGADAVQREIAEADVFAVDGDRLILLNTWRGLAIVDLVQFSILGRLPLHGMPHEVHLLGTRALVLVGGETSDGVSETRLIEVDLTNVQAPLLAREVAMPGWFRTSRRVGQALYVLTSAGARSYGLGAVPFTDVDAVTVPGHNLFAHATADALFVAGTSEYGDQSMVTVLDISSPQGQIVRGGSVTLPGTIQDDQKLHYGGGCLRVVTFAWSQSHLFTIDVDDVELPRVLGELTFARNEQLFATCFDDERGYIVTFERIDPLWVVDLRDPLHPRMAGELHVPGFSTQLVCSGDQLVSLGYADARGRPAVSLFDVSLPDQPQLLSRLEIDGVDYAAFQERRAMFVNDTTVLVPTWDGLAVVDRGPTTLSLRGRFSVRGGSQRGLLHARGVVAIGNERVVVADPATLLVRGEVAIASNVVDVARLGDGSLLELVQSGEIAELRDVEIPLWPERLFVDGQAAAVIGFDVDGRAVRTVDFSSVPPRVSARIALGMGRYAAPTSPRGGLAMPGGVLIGGYYSSSSDVQLHDGLLLARGLPASTGIALGTGEAQDGFAVVDIAAGTALPGITVRGAAITGVAVAGNELAVTIGRGAGFDAGSRPMLRNELWRLDPRQARSKSRVAVPGTVVAIAGDVVHTVEERWRDDWTVAAQVTALRLHEGRAERLGSRGLGDSAWDFHVDAGTLYYGSMRNALVPWFGNIVMMPTVAIESVRLSPGLPHGPSIEADAYRRMLTVRDGLLVASSGALGIELWDMNGTVATLQHAVAVDGYASAARPDPQQAGYFLLALGYAGSAIVP